MELRRLSVAKSWPIAWLAVYISILVFGLISPGSILLNTIKLSGIFLCFVYTVVTFPSDRLLILALFLTCAADLFLAFNNTSLVGLIIFVAAQVTHLIRLDFERYRDAVILFSVVAFVMITLVLIFQFAPPIYVVAAFYGVTLTLNLIAAWRWWANQTHNPHARFALGGFLLFAACDLCVSTSYLSSISFISAGFYAPANYLAWCFYYPAQVLLANSTRQAPLAQPQANRS